MDSAQHTHPGRPITREPRSYAEMSVQAMRHRERLVSAGSATADYVFKCTYAEYNELHRWRGSVLVDIECKHICGLLIQPGKRPRLTMHQKLGDSHGA